MGKSITQQVEEAVETEVEKLTSTFTGGFAFTNLDADTMLQNMNADTGTGKLYLHTVFLPKQPTFGMGCFEQLINVYFAIYSQNILADDIKSGITGDTVRTSLNLGLRALMDLMTDNDTWGCLAYTTFPIELTDEGGSITTDKNEIIRPVANLAYQITVQWPFDDDESAY